MILGANGIGRSAMEAFISNGVVVYGFLDDDAEMHGKEIGDVAVLGDLSDNEYMAIIGKDCQAFVATEEIELRKSLVETLMSVRKSMPVNAIHQSAVLSPSFSLGHGNFIAARVAIGTDVKVGNHTIIHSGVVLNTDSEIGDFVQVGAGSIINSGVKVAEEAFIGSGVTIVSGIKIGSRARIGAGSVVIKDVEEGQTVFGNPAEPV